MALPNSDISQLIRIKERELHEIHDMRCSQLEKLVSERDNLLLEASRRFEQLRDDFQYNLALLEARDQELRRLEGIISDQAKRMDAMESERKTLSERVDILSLREAERSEQLQEEKSSSKAKLLSLREEIEKLGWIGAEEVKAKAREVETLRDDLRRLNSSRDEALEHQRRDLTHTFEQLLQQREEHFSTREQEIASQVAALDERFEQLKTENVRLKAECIDSHRRIESLLEDVSTKEGLLRQTLWRVEDDRQSRIQADDALQRQLQQLTVELAVAKENNSRESSEFQKRLEQCLGELAREKEFRLSLESRFEDRRHQFQNELRRLESEVHDARAREELAQRDAGNCRVERDEALDRAALTRAEADAADARAKSVSRQALSLQEELSAALQRIQQLEANLEQAADDAEQSMKQAADAIMHAEQSTREEMAAARRAAEETVAIHQRQTDEDLEHIRHATKSVGEEIVAETSRRFEMQLNEATMRVKRLSDELLAVQSVLNEKEDELREERAETAALRLRLRFHDSQTTGAVRAQLDEQYPLRVSLGTDNGGDFAFSARDNDPRTHQFGAELDSSGYGDLPSPMFSEDYGPASIPDSPFPTPLRSMGMGAAERSAPRTNSSVGPSRRGPGISLAPPAPPPLPPQSHSSGHMDYAAAAGQRDSLLDENERLRQAIREMRADMEAIKTQASASKPERDEFVSSTLPIASSSDSRVVLLEEKLEKTVNEITRLRAERRRLMDVSNELRAAVSRTAPRAVPARETSGYDSPAPPQPTGRWDADNRHQVYDDPYTLPTHPSPSPLRSRWSTEHESQRRERERTATVDYKSSPLLHGALSGTGELDVPGIVKSELDGVHGRGIGTQQRGSNHNVAPSFLTNSSRTTASQIQARERLSQHSKTRDTSSQRNVMNYAQAGRNYPVEDR